MVPMAGAPWGCGPNRCGSAKSKPLPEGCPPSVCLKGHLCPLPAERRYEEPHRSHAHTSPVQAEPRSPHPAQVWSLAMELSIWSNPSSQPWHTIHPLQALPQHQLPPQRSCMWHGVMPGFWQWGTLCAQTFPARGDLGCGEQSDANTFHSFPFHLCPPAPVGPLDPVHPLLWIWPSLHQCCCPSLAGLCWD